MSGLRYPYLAGANALDGEHKRSKRQPDTNCAETVTPGEGVALDLVQSYHLAWVSV